MPSPGPLRIVTYNVRSCRGMDGRLDPKRVVRVLEAARPDVAGLQELDALQERSKALHQAEYIADLLGMQAFYVPARRAGSGHYGNALFCKLPCEAVQSGALPQLHASSEPRAAQWLAVFTAWGRVDVINTHLGLRRQEQLIQALHLLGTDWLAHAEMGPNIVLCGDLNARPGSAAYAALALRLWDAQGHAGQKPLGTYPAPYPFLRIDHVFTSPTLAVEHVHVPSGLARIASDHRPLVVDLVPRQPVWSQ